MQSLPSATPIGLMMEVRRWTDNVKKTCELDASSGFLKSLPEFFPQDTAPEKLHEVGTHIAKHLKLWLDKVLEKVT